MHHLGHLEHGHVGEAEPLHQRLEGAILAAVGELHLEHVKGNRGWMLLGVVGEDKRGIGPVLACPWLSAGSLDTNRLEHMTQETPRYLFLHYWGKGRAGSLAASLKEALDTRK